MPASRRSCRSPSGNGSCGHWKPGCHPSHPAARPGNSRKVGSRPSSLSPRPSLHGPGSAGGSPAASHGKGTTVRRGGAGASGPGCNGVKQPRARHVRGSVGTCPVCCPEQPQWHAPCFMPRDVTRSFSCRSPLPLRFPGSSFSSGCIRRAGAGRLRQDGFCCSGPCWRWHTPVQLAGQPARFGRPGRCALGPESPGSNPNGAEAPPRMAGVDVVGTLALTGPGYRLPPTSGMGSRSGDPAGSGNHDAALTGRYVPECAGPASNPARHIPPVRLFALRSGFVHALVVDPSGGRVAGSRRTPGWDPAGAHSGSATRTGRCHGFARLPGRHGGCLRRPNPSGRTGIRTPGPPGPAGFACRLIERAGTGARRCRH